MRSPAADPLMSAKQGSRGRSECARIPRKEVHADVAGSRLVSRASDSALGVGSLLLSVSRCLQTGPASTDTPAVAVRQAVPLSRVALCDTMTSGWD